MILGTFSRDDILKTFRHVASVLEERAHGYYYHNEKAVLKKLRPQESFGESFPVRLTGSGILKQSLFTYPTGLLIPAVRAS